MTLKIIHKNNTSAGQAPASGDLDIGEIAVNSADGKLYTKDNDGAIQSFTNDNDALTVQQFTQAGSGAVQRTVESKLQDVVSAKDFGAVGDGVTDDTAAIQAAVEAAKGKAVVFEGGKTYLISSELSFSGIDISLRSEGVPATIFLNGQNDNGFLADNTAFSSTTLSSSTAKYSRTWTVANASGITPGMIMEIKSDVLWYYDNRGLAKKSELHLVESVSGNDVRTYLAANDGYDTSTETVTVTFYDPIKVNIQNINFKAVPQLNPSSPKFALRIRYSSGLRITGVAAEGFQAVGLSLVGCYDTKVTRHTGIDCNYFTTGYGAQTYGCTNTVFSNCYYRGCRRGIDISGGEVISLHTLIENCVNDGGGYSSNGDQWGLTDSGSSVGAAVNYGFGSHGPSDHLTYRGNRMNTYFGINTRGGNEVIENNEFFDHVTDCVTLSYGANRIIRNNTSLPGLTDKDITRYNGGANIYNYIPENLVFIGDTFDGGDYVEITGNSGNLNSSLIEFQSGAVVPTTGFVIKNNNIKFLIPTSANDNYLFNNLNISSDPARNTTPTVPVTLSGNIFESTHTTGEIVLSNNLTFSPIKGNYQGTYAPTFTTVSNITSITQLGIDWRYVVNGNVVNIFGAVSITHTSTSADSRFRVTLPFPYNLTINASGGGIMTYTSIQSGSDSAGTGFIDSATDTLQFTVEAALSGTSLSYSVSAWYYLDL